MRRKSGPSSTCAPTLRSSVAIAAMRSVSFTRQLPMLRSVLGPSANSASTAAVIAASGMWFRSRSTARSGARPRHLDPVRAERDLGAHRAQHLGEAHVALDARASDALDAHRPAADRARGEEVRRRRRVAFDVEARRGCDSAARGHREPPPAVALDLDAEAPHQVERDLDVGLGHSSPVDLDRARSPGERQRHQQRGQELARDVAADARARRRARSRRPDRRAAGNPRGPGSRCRAPSARSASTRSPIGRSCMRGTPESR